VRPNIKERKNNLILIDNLNKNEKYYENIEENNMINSIDIVVFVI